MSRPRRFGRVFVPQRSFYTPSYANLHPGVENLSGSSHPHNLDGSVWPVVAVVLCQHVLGVRYEFCGLPISGKYDNRRRVLLTRLQQ